MGLTIGCNCVADPYACLGDDEYVTQLNEHDGHFKTAPQPHRENELSVLRGRRTLEESLLRRIRRLKPPLEQSVLEGRMIRIARVGDLREAGFGVVHTPAKKIKKDIHVSLVIPAHPDSDVMAEWPTTPIDFPEILDSLFAIQVTQEVKK